MNTRFLVLWLEGNLQSWGANSKFGNRSTEVFPTKSGVLGLLLAAMGMGGPQEESLAELASLRQDVYCFRRGAEVSILNDFQMVGSGYDIDDPWQLNLIPKKRDGNKAKGGGSKLTYKQYLQDTKFCVIQEIPVDKENLIVDSLQHPVWPLYLGRRCCIPTREIFNGCFDSYDEARDHIHKDMESACESIVLYQIVKDGKYQEEGTVMLVSDYPVAFGDAKKYKSRYITIIKGEE